MKKINAQDLKILYDLHFPKIATFLEYYKAYVMYSMDRAAELMKKDDTKWMSAIASPTLFSIVSAVYGIYLDSEMAFEVYKVAKRWRQNYSDEVNEEDVQAAVEIANKDKQVDAKTQENIDIMLDIIESIYAQEGVEEQIDRISLDAILLGTGFGKVILDQKKETYNTRYFDEKTQAYKRRKETFSQKIPGLSYISPMDLIPFDSGGYKGLEGCRAVMRRGILAKSKVNSEYGSKDGQRGFDIDRSQATDNGIIDRNDRDMKIRYMLFNNMPKIGGEYFNTLRGISQSSPAGFMVDDIISNNSFKIGLKDDKAHGSESDGTDDLVELFEVYYGNSMQLFVNSKDCGVKEMIGPWMRSPFFAVNFKRGLNGIYGMGAGHVARPLHQIQTAFLNLRVDIAKINANKPMAIASDEAIFEGEDYMPTRPNQLIKLHDPEKGIRPLFPDLTGGEIANAEVERTGKMIQDSLGISGYTMGVQQKVERAAKNVQELVKSSERGQKEFVKSRGRAMSFIAKYRILIARELSDDELIEMCGTAKIKEIPFESLIKEYNITFNMSPNQSTINEAKTQITNQIIKDRAQITRADGSPLLDTEAGFRSILELSGLDDSLVLTNEEAKEKLEEKLKRDADIEVYKRQLAQANGLDQTAPEQVVTGPGQGTTQGSEGLLPVAGVQGGSSVPGEYRETNPTGINE